jgi:hypothetical protein
MEKIIIDDKISIYKTYLDISEYKNSVLKECYTIMDSQPNVKEDNFFLAKEQENNNFKGEFEIKRNIDKIINFGIKSCIDLYVKNFNKEYNQINTDSWLNVVRCNSPKQKIFKNKTKIITHIHTDLNKSMDSFVPIFTYVCYIQMPNNLVDKDGVLYIKGENNTMYDILPNEGDLIIFNADIPHVPAAAHKSTKDRIVVAGNVGFQFVKKTKGLI